MTYFDCYRYDGIEARDEREAAVKAAQTFNAPPKRHWQIAVTKLPDKSER
jgi:hypothetical protein